LFIFSDGKAIVDASSASKFMRTLLRDHYKSLDDKTDESGS
jgi:hypothetical protein